MESRVLVVSLFAPYTVNFDKSTAEGPATLHRVTRTNSVARNSAWKGRRSSVHRTHSTPLDHHGQPHSRRRSSFSINSFKLSPISRTESKGKDASTAATAAAAAANPLDLEHPAWRSPMPLAPHAEGDSDGEDDTAPVTTNASTLSQHITKQTELDLADIGSAVSSINDTPPPNTLDYSRLKNLDLLRKKKKMPGSGQASITGSSCGGSTVPNTPSFHPLYTSSDPKHYADLASDGTDTLSDFGPDKVQPAHSTHPGIDSGRSILAGSKIGNTDNFFGITCNDPNVVSDGDKTTSPVETPWDASIAVAGTDVPFIVEHLNVGNIGLFNAVNASLDTFAERVWIGELGISTDTWSDSRKTAVTNHLLDNFETIPVFVSEKEFEGHYSRFCKQLIWPVFHYVMPEMPRWHGWERSAYEATVATCKKFADRIVEFYRDGDVIWINDYHLMLLPQLLRQRLPSAKIGFFLHIPFPSSEIFRCLHVRHELLEGMLGADVVGFQTFSYKRHFIQTCQRVLGVEGSPGGLILEDSAVVVCQYAMGLDPATVEAKLQDPAVKEVIGLLKEKYAGKNLLVGRDKLDHVKGVRQKLLGYEQFLIDHPQYASRTVLIQIALTTAEHNELQAQVIDVVGRINSRFGNIEHQPVVFFHQDIPYNQYLALLSTADAMMVMSLRDGMNLTSHEFVLSQKVKHSPLIMSEFVGTYGAFGGGALGVNPMDTRAIATAIRDALTMSPEEKQYRWELLYNQVLTNSAKVFVSSFVTDIENVHNDVQQRYSAKLPGLDMEKELPPLHASNRRLIILDYDGVLVPITRNSPTQSIYDHAKEWIKRLVADHRNMVMVFSDRSTKSLDALLGDIPELSMCSEYGCFVRGRFQKAWHQMVNIENMSWREIAAEVFEFYTDRIPGSYVENKAMSSVWDFRQADNFAFGKRQALECQNHINDLLGSSYPVHAVASDATVEVFPRAASRSNALRYILETPSIFNPLLSDGKTQRYKNGHIPIDYVMLFGANRLEESTFTILHQWRNRLAEYASPDASSDLLASPVSKSRSSSLSSGSINGFPASTPVTLPLVTKDVFKQKGPIHLGGSPPRYPSNSTLPQTPPNDLSTSSGAGEPIDSNATRVEKVYSPRSSLAQKFILLTASVSNKSIDAQYFIPGVKVAFDMLQELLT